MMMLDDLNGVELPRITVRILEISYPITVLTSVTSSIEVKDKLRRIVGQRRPHYW